MRDACLRPLLASCSAYVAAALVFGALAPLATASGLDAGGAGGAAAAAWRGIADGTAAQFGMPAQRVGTEVVAVAALYFALNVLVLRLPGRHADPAACGPRGRWYVPAATPLTAPDSPAPRNPPSP
jgi:hypothetical protein